MHLMLATISAMVLRSQNGSAFAMEVMPVLDVIDFRDELFLDRVTSVKTVKGLTHNILQIVVGLLNLSDVHGLKLDKTLKSVSLGRERRVTYIYHLSEPVEDDVGLVRWQSVEFLEEDLLPHDLGVGQNFVNQVHP